MGVLGSVKYRSVAVIALVAALAFTSVLDKALDWAIMESLNQQCTAYLDDWTGQAIGTIASAAIINSSLSVIEDSEAEITPLGVGVSLALGDAVRPVNDMVEKVLSVALVSAVSLAIQQSLLEVGATVGLKWLLTISLGFLAAGVIWDRRVFSRLAWTFLVLALVARFFLPGAVFLTGQVGDAFTERASAAAQQELEQLESDATGVSKLNVWKIADQIKARADIYIKMAVSYIAVFIMQTMLIPIFILWLLAKLPSFLLGPASAKSGGERWLAYLRGTTSFREATTGASSFSD